MESTTKLYDYNQQWSKDGYWENQYSSTKSCGWLSYFYKGYSSIIRKCRDFPPSLGNSKVGQRDKPTVEEVTVGPNESKTYRTETAEPK